MRFLQREKCVILPLVLKGKWYDMIANGIKTEEYREDKPYWRIRISNWVTRLPSGGHLVVAFSRGRRTPDLFVEASGVNIYPNCLHPDWGEPTGSHYVIALKRRVTLAERQKGGVA